METNGDIIKTKNNNSTTKDKTFMLEIYFNSGLAPLI